MNLEGLYQKIGGNYRSITERLGKEERIEKFVRLFLKDHSYQTLTEAMEQGKVEEAFRAAHTLKGVCMNLSFDALYKISSNITESLRGKDTVHAAEEFMELETCYEKHVQAIREYVESRDREEKECQKI
jgi:HPt (histidine-containing phosphotransfer) domain-containing protein